MSPVQSTTLAAVQAAPVGACTPAAMRHAGVPFDAAHWFQCHALRKGVKTQTELTVFQLVRTLVGASRMVH
jgi:hypothetical protein